MRRTLALSLVLLAGCSRAPLRPEEVSPDDMCAHCRMAISERRYAAELVAPDGEAAKFDELGCLLRYLEGAGSRDWRGGFFVVDVETGEWLHAGEAFFVRSREFKTPMGGGIIAFRERHRAEASSRRHGGELLGFEELIRVRPSGP